MNTREDNISLLKVFAAILVITLHTIGIYLGKNVQSMNVTFYISAIISIATRVCLPLFVLISGRYLLTNWRNRSAMEFYKSKLPRILVPLIAWNFLYLIYRFFTEADFTLSKGLIDIANSGAYIHLWYFYLLLLLYLLTPLITKIINKISRRDLIILTVALLLIGSVAEYFRTLTGFKNLPIYYPVEFIGYYLAGYALKDYKVKFNKYFLLILYIGLATVGAFVSISYVTKGNIFVFQWFNMSVDPIALFGSISLYLFASNSAVKNSKIANLSKYNLGIYVIHLGILNFFLMKTNGILTGIDLLDLLLLVSVTFVLSVLASMVLYKNKYTRMLVS